ncbi:MAG: nitroreductase family protein [Pseudomonadota bacterium]
MSNLLQTLQTRRSALSLTLEAPGPDTAQMETIVTIASRVPDHGKLAPWRFEAWSMGRRERLHGELTQWLASEPSVSEGQDPAKLQQQTDKLLHGPSLLVCVSRAQANPKIPMWEQHLSAGAACMKALMAANALGFEAQWLTAWYIYAQGGNAKLGLAEHEQVAGLIHIGSTSTPKSERPRPELAEIYTVVD